MYRSIGSLLFLCVAVFYGELAPLSFGDDASESSVTSQSRSPRMQSLEESLKMFQRRVELNPKDYLSRTILGRLHLKQAKMHGVEESYGKAEESFRSALEINSEHLTARAYLAVALNSQHKFSEGLDQSERVLRADSEHLLATAARGDALLELGRYEEAEVIYDRLEKSAPSPAVWSRQAHLAELVGDDDEALRYLRQALAEQEKVVRGSSQSDAWYRMRLATFYFKRGEFSLSEKLFSTALKERANYQPALIGYSRLRAAQGRYKEAIHLLEQVTNEAPHFDLLGELAALYELAGDTEQANEIRQRAIEKSSDAVGVIMEARHLAMFYADHGIRLGDAVELAKSDLKMRSDIYAWDTLAWTLHQQGDFLEASEAMNSALKLGTNDPLLFFHAGMIQQSLGHSQTADDFFTRLNNMNSRFSPLHLSRIEMIADSNASSNQTAEQRVMP